MGVESIDLIIFAKVGELGSMAGAARALGIAKASVSRAMMRLEATYGTRLLDRAGRRITMTEAGRILHAHTLTIRQELAEAEARLAAHCGIPSGILRVGASGDVARELLEDELHEFLARYPDIDLRVRIGERLLPELDRLDVVLHAGWLSDSSLTARKLATVRMILVASRAYLDVHGTPTSIGQLAGHPVMGNFYLEPTAAAQGDLPAHVPTLNLMWNGERHRVLIWRRFVSTDHVMMQRMVERGVAIASIPAIRVGEALRSGALVHILPDHEIDNPPTIYALYTDRISSSPKVRAFVDFVGEVARRRFDFS